MAMGGEHWIAGVQYIHSLLYGNSLLPSEERGSLYLYLDFAQHRLSDYAAVRQLADRIQVTEFWSAESFRPYYNLRSVIGIVAREKRWPGWPRFALPEALRRDHIEILFAGHNVRPGLGLPQICWIPDFQHRHRPELFSNEEWQSRDRFFAEMMAEADRLVLSNRFSYEDAVRLYPQSREKLAVLPFTMYLGRGWRQPDPAVVVRKYRLPPKFLLFPSQFWKHKNHLAVFKAIHLLRQRGLNDVVLVCTGFPHDSRFPHYRDEVRSFLSDHNLEQVVRVLGLLPRSEQVQLMRAAAAIVQSSSFEGWSAVVEEGRSLGKVVFATDIPMHREQLAEKMYLFDPASAEMLADLLAAHWPSLSPGPDRESESVAESEYHNRIRHFARQFLTLCHGLSHAK